MTDPTDPRILEAERNGTGERTCQADFCKNEAVDGAFCDKHWQAFDEARDYED